MHIPCLDVRGVAPAQIPALFAERHLTYTPVRCVNWPALFPCCPGFTFAMACTEDGLLIHYRVEEEHVRAVTGQDFGPVWEDSCAEFFFSPEGSGVYYNLECNCVGCLHLAVGAGRHGREKADAGLLETIGRWTSLGRTPFGEKDGRTAWEAALTVPYSAFWKHRPLVGPGTRGAANVYACREGAHPHFISLFPVRSGKPDFHRPECFGEAVFGEL